MSRDEDRPPGHHRQVGHQGVLRQADRRPEEGRHLIGQFGVGFYSAFIVADKVTVLSRRAGLEAPSQGVKWECSMTGDEAGELHRRDGRQARPRHRDHPAPARRPGRPAVVWKLKSLIRKYSDHIVQPIVMKKEEWNEEQKEQVVTDEDETVNQANALWARAKNDITDEQYKEFYKHVAHDFETRWRGPTARVEGRTNTPSCSTSRPARPSTCGTATPSTASSSTCAASSSWTTPRS
jgi:HSP90 family molecular chaperone